MIEPLYARLIREIHGVEVPTPVPADDLRRDDRAVRLRQAGPPVRDGAGRPGRGVRGDGIQRVRIGRAADGGAIKGSARPGRRQLSPQGARRARRARPRAVARPASCGWSSRTTACARRSRSSCRRTRSRACSRRDRRRRRATWSASSRTARDRVARGARRAAAAPGGPARADPRGRVGVLLVHGAAAVRVERRGRAVGGASTIRSPRR